MFYLVFLSLVPLVFSQSNPVVKVQHGLLSGSWKVSQNGRNYASFQGIPYARPPVGKYRFREPQKLKPWSGVWDATQFLPMCLQYDPFEDKILGQEDCLFANVYTPNTAPGANLPVMVFIHGGAFMYGAGGCHYYIPNKIMDKDMVVVTFNYRLGPLGFLSTADEAIPGNFGLKDQAFALNWVKQNIKMFGGNPNSITLTGNSAGAASVHYHYLSPLSRGTFDRGITFSGSALSPWTYQHKPKRNAKTLASIVGCPDSSSQELAECLRYRPAEVLVRAQLEMLEWKDRMFTLFVPTIEPASPSAFLTKHPHHATLAGDMARVPLIATVTAEEGLYPAAVYQKDPPILEELEDQWDTLASHIFVFNDTLPTSSKKVAVAHKIKQKYLDGKPVSQETFAPLVEALSDRLFIADVGKLAQAHATKSGQPAYLYKYSYRSEISLSMLMARNNVIYGASHADDLFHFFEFPYLENPKDETKEMINFFVDLIYSYAAHGIPKVNNVEWTPVKPGSSELDYLEIQSPAKQVMKKDSDFGNRSFWDSLGFLENENYKIVRDEL